MEIRAFSFQPCFHNQQPIVPPVMTIQDSPLTHCISCTRNKTNHCKGAWSKEEDERLRIAVSSCSPPLWDDIAKSVHGRTPKQCRERWLYRLRPELKKTPFEHWEDQLIFEQKKKIGNRWTQIAMMLPGRTSCSVKNRWYTVLRNKFCDGAPPKQTSEQKNNREELMSVKFLLNWVYHFMLYEIAEFFVINLSEMKLFTTIFLSIFR